MSVLKKQMQLRLEAQKRTQKQLAMELAEVAVEGERPAATATVEKNLALLGTGDESASKFFFDHPARLERLARELGAKIDEVRAWKNAPTLVLGPDLPPEFVEFITRPETSDHFTRFEVDARWSTKEELRDAVKAENNAVLVLGKESQMSFGEFLSGAGVMEKAQSAQAVPRGWRISGYLDLLKIPPPRAPEFFTKDGRPLFRHPDEKQRLDAREEERLLSLGQFNGAVGADLRWEHDSLWSWKPIAFDVALLMPHNPPRIIEPEFLEMVRGRSPIGFTAESFVAFVASAKVSFHESMWAWLGGEPQGRERSADDSRSKTLFKRLVQRSDVEVVMACVRDDEQAPRDLIRSLLLRGWGAGFSKSLPELTTALHELRAVAEADWVIVKLGGRWELTANLGAGRLCFARLWHFDRETPRAVDAPALPTWFEESSVPTGFDRNVRWFDGGDVLLSLNRSYSEMLEGAIHRPRNREEERRALAD